MPFRTSWATVALLKKAAGKVVELESTKRIPRWRISEYWIQGFMLGYLERSIGRMYLEHVVGYGRVDFYHRGARQSAIELAVMKDRKYPRWEHLPDKNKSEVKKLRSLSHPQNLNKYLLLIDLVGKNSLEKKALQLSYSKYFKNFGKRRPKITVIYVHKSDSFSFRV